MLVEKITKQLYDDYSDNVNKVLVDPAAYKEACDKVKIAMKRVENIIPRNRRKLYFELENSINHREVLSGKEAYNQGFNQGVQFILEILMNK